MGDNKDIIRQGVVSSLNYEEGRARVVYQDKNGAVTKELPLLTFEYDMPRVGEEVYVAHQSNGVEDGLVLCRYWRDSERPVEFGPHIWRKEFRDDAGSFVKFDRATHTLTINIAASPDISLNIIAAKDVTVTSKGNVTVNADKDVTIAAKGNVTVNADKQLTVTALKEIAINAPKKPIDIFSKKEVTITSKAAINLVAPAINEIIIPPDPGGDD